MVLYKSRGLKGRRVLIVLLWNLLVFSYSQSALSSLVYFLIDHKAWIPHPWLLAVIAAGLTDVLPKFFYPLAGWLADAKLGRYKVMRYSMWMMWLGSAFLILTSIIGPLLPDTEGKVEMHFTLVALVVVYIINALGIAGYHVNVIPFGIDQMEGPSGEQIASFIHWYYWTRNFNFGVLVQLVVQLIGSYCTKDSNSDARKNLDLAVYFVQMVFLTAALCLDFLFSSKLFKDNKVHDPGRKVMKVSAFIFKHKHPVGPRLAHTHAYDDPPARSDLAKRTYGGPFEDDAVEEVVSFWRMLLFLLVTEFAAFLIQTGYYVYPNFFEHMNSNHSFQVFSECTNEYLITNVVILCTFTLSIPFYEFVIYPIFRNRIPRITVRISLGLLVTLLGMSALLAVDIVGHYNQLLTLKDDCMFYTTYGKIWIDSFYLGPIIVVMACGEMLVFISILEFILAQSPYGMRGLMLGIDFMLYGIFSGFGAIFLQTLFSLGFRQTDNYTLGLPSCGTSYLLTMIALGCVGAFVYLLSVQNYKMRQRGGQVDHNPQAVIESLTIKYAETRKRN